MMETANKSTEIVEVLRGAATRADAIERLADLAPLRKVDLLAAARTLSVDADARHRKTEITRRLIDATAGTREDAAAINSNGWR